MSTKTTTMHHGTYGRYATAGCRCLPCRAAKARYVREQRAQRKSMPIPAYVEHGKRSTYDNWACRCTECFKAHEAARIDYIGRAPVPPHGTYRRYLDFACRCDDCRAAASARYYRRKAAS